jgi:hypothetical protein
VLLSQKVSLPFSTSQRYPFFMASLSEIEKLALALSERERETLAAKLIESLSNAEPGEGAGDGAVRFKPVKSSMLRRVRYDPKQRLLDVVFRTGETYRYKEVPLDEYHKLMRAESLGRYMQIHIIDCYETIRLED